MLPPLFNNFYPKIWYYVDLKTSLYCFVARRYFSLPYISPKYSCGYSLNMNPINMAVSNLGSYIGRCSIRITFYCLPLNNITQTMCLHTKMMSNHIFYLHLVYYLGGALNFRRPSTTSCNILTPTSILYSKHLVRLYRCRYSYRFGRLKWLKHSNQIKNLKYPAVCLLHQFATPEMCT